MKIINVFVILTLDGKGNQLNNPYELINITSKLSTLIFIHLKQT